MTYSTTIAPCFDAGQLEDVPAVFDADVQWIERDTSVGIMRGYWSVNSVELLTFQIGAMQFSRACLIDMADRDEARRVEACAVKSLSALLEYEDESADVDCIADAPPVVRLSMGAF